MDNVKGRDQAIYKCRVDFRQAPTRISNINLHNLIRYHQTQQEPATMTVWPLRSQFGIMDISDEKFVKDKYFAKVNVNFNKKNVYNFFESKKIFPSIPTKLDLLILPILVDSNKNEIIFFGENPIYNNWNKYNQKYHLLTYILPSEDIEDNQVLKNNIEFIEE